MNKETVKKYLSEMFVPRDEPLEGVCFRSEFMNKEHHEAYPIQRIISNAQRESGLSFDFSYEIASRAVDVLSNVDDWEDDDAITEAVDSSVPIYTYDLMKIYASDSWAVDETREEMGTAENSEKQAQWAWYAQIESMVQSIKSKVEEIINEDDAILA